jgi:hypothetical protein
MNNLNFEFKSYIPTPDDQYMLGIAKVKLYGKIIVVYKHVKTKDGSGTFFCTQNYSLKDALGEKKYINCVQLDSRDDEEELMEVIRQGVHMCMSQRSAHQVQRSAAPTTYYAPPATQSQGVAADEQLPF